MIDYRALKRYTRKIDECIDYLERDKFEGILKDFSPSFREAVASAVLERQNLLLEQLARNGVNIDTHV